MAQVSRRILILANPVAGGGRGRIVAQDLARLLQAQGCAVEVFLSRHKGDAGDRAAQAGPEPWDALVAVGGDGTLNEVLNGMPDPSRPLGMAPVGTANVLACEYRLPRRLPDLAELLAKGAPKEHAIGLAGARRFLLFCGAGLDAAIVEELERMRRGTLGKRKWLAPILGILRRWPRHSLRAEFADGACLTGLSSVLVTRVQNYGGIASLPRGIDPAEPVLHALCFSGTSRVWWLWQGLRAALGLMRPGRGLQVVRTTAVRVGGDAPTHVDGDALGRTPIEIRLHDRPARLLVP